MCSHMVDGYTEGACARHTSSYVDALDLDAKGPDRVDDASMLSSFFW